MLNFGLHILLSVSKENPVPSQTHVEQIILLSLFNKQAVQPDGQGIQLTIPLLKIPYFPIPQI